MEQGRLDRKPLAKASVGLRTVAAFEAAKGAIVLMLGCGVLDLIHKNLDDIAERLAEVLHVNPEGKLSNLFVKLGCHATDRALWVLAIGVLVYAAVRSIEAYGLWREREWAQWFELLSTALYLPPESYWLLRHPTWLKWVHSYKSCGPRVHADASPQVRNQQNSLTSVMARWAQVLDSGVGDDDEEAGDSLYFQTLGSLEEVSMAQDTPVDIVRQASGWSIAWGILLIILGMLAFASPFLAAVAVNVLVAWLIVLAGIVHVVLAFHAHRAGSLIWKLLVGLAYLFFGIYLIVHPVLGVTSLTLVLASLFLVEGVLDIILFVRMRSLGGGGWVLVDGIVTLLLGLLIYLQWPSSSLWAIGTLVGVSLMISGITRVMLSLTVRKATTVTA